jgi:hypothetical protein
MLYKLVPFDNKTNNSRRVCVICTMYMTFLSLHILVFCTKCCKYTIFIKFRKIRLTKPLSLPAVRECLAPQFQFRWQGSTGTDSPECKITMVPLHTQAGVLVRKLSQLTPLSQAKRANLRYFIKLCGISCELAGCVHRPIVDSESTIAG